MEWIDPVLILISAMLGSSVLTALITQVFLRRKLLAEAGKIKAERETSVVANYQKLVEDLNRLHQKQIEDLTSQVKNLEQREIEVLKQNTLILEDKRELLGHYKDLKSEMETVRNRMMSYEQALKAHNIPLPK